MASIQCNIICRVMTYTALKQGMRQLNYFLSVELLGYFLLICPTLIVLSALLKFEEKESNSYLILVNIFCYMLFLASRKWTYGIIYFFVF